MLPWLAPGNPGALRDAGTEFRVPAAGRIAGHGYLALKPQLLDVAQTDLSQRYKCTA
ncbi:MULTISPECIES: hypothetical protein [Paraburkholderia]|uniref:Uncharacterized protein n=3 Tax=Paraburkholderia TaxID=1822464 RepID=A0ABU9SL34_9BURK|nr:hypothetical protein [Paraburkholderia nodosa]